MNVRLTVLGVLLLIVHQQVLVVQVFAWGCHGLWQASKKYFPLELTLGLGYCLASAFFVFVSFLADIHQSAATMQGESQNISRSL